MDANHKRLRAEGKLALGGLLQHSAYMYKPETITGTQPVSHFSAKRAAAKMLSNYLEMIISSVELNVSKLCKLFSEEPRLCRA